MIQKNEINDQQRMIPISDRIESEQLMSGKREIIIVHNNQEYKLRLTGNGKLILTK